MNFKQPTPPRSNSSKELEQALLALQDLLAVLPFSTNPVQTSAIQQAKIVLKRHRRRQMKDLLAELIN